MSGIGLSKAVNGDFLRRFATLASKSQSPGAALRGPLGNDQAITAGLRIGARTFSAALDGLNSAVSFVNLSEKTLTDLSDLTDKLIDVTRRATDVASSRGTRADLDVEFKRLAGEFKRTVKNATTGDNQFLTKEGLSEIFATIGLDKKSSDSIAQVFSQFVTPVTDDTLASEDVSAPQASIPVGAFSDRRSDSAVLVDRISNSGIAFGRISTVGSVVNDEDTLLNQNPGYQSIITTATNGSVTSVHAGEITHDVTLLAVNETNGYSVVTSRTDFLGHNPLNRPNLFLVDATGNVVHQVTDNTSPFMVYNSADVSEDNLTVAYTQLDAIENAVVVATISSIGDDPALSSFAPIYTGGHTITLFTGVKIDNAGEHLAFQDTFDDPVESFFYSITLDSFDGIVGSNTDITSYGFSDTGKLIYNDGTGVYRQIFGEVTSRDILLQPGLTKVEVLEDSASEGYFSAYDTSTNILTVYDVSTVQAQIELQLDPADDVNIDTVSLAFNVDGSHIDIGLAGNLASLGGGGSDELYRIEYNPAYEAGVRSSHATPSLLDPITGEQRTSIFDDSRSIANRAEAYRTLEDLKALKSQITQNLKGLEFARDILSDNIDLVRAAGVAFLELSSQVKDSTDAEVLAEKLRQRIRDSAPTALSQAENLNPITVAALTYAG